MWVLFFFGSIYDINRYPALDDLFCPMREFLFICLNFIHKFVVKTDKIIYTRVVFVYFAWRMSKATE